MREVTEFGTVINNIGLFKPLFNCKVNILGLRIARVSGTALTEPGGTNLNSQRECIQKTYKTRHRRALPVFETRTDMQ